MATARSIELDTAHELDAQGELRTIWGAAAVSLLFVVAAEVCLYLEVFSVPV